MPPTGIHGLSGLLLGWKSPNRDFKLGIAFGAMAPDFDFFLAAILYLMTQNEEVTINAHRTVTHSLIFMILLLGIGITLGWTPMLKQRSFRGILLGSFVVGTSLGVAFHSIFDLLYIDGVALFWPFQGKIYVTPVVYSDLSDFGQKIFGVIDFGFEGAWWGFMAYLAKQKETADSILLPLTGRKINNFRRKLQFLAGGELALMLGFFFLAFLPLNLVTFIILLYIPGLPILAFSCFLPFLMQDTIESH